MDSLILSSAEKHSLTALTGLNENSFSLLWRGSRDGFEPETFHRLCDGQGKTLTIIKNNKGFIFGGFTSVPWSSKGGDITDYTAFLFTLTNSSDTPMR